MTNCPATGSSLCTPDAFASELLARNPAVVLEVIAAQATDLKNPPHTALDVALKPCLSSPPAA